MDLENAIEVLAIWYAALGTRGDWLCMIAKMKDDPDRWTMRYRFRWYKDRKAFDSDDVKNWYVAKTEHSASEALATMDMVANFIAAPYGATVDRIFVQGDARKALELLSKRPWAHVRREPIS